jgi:SAM-dependent methyltransferase
MAGDARPPWRRVAGSARHRLRRAGWSLEDRLLDAEQARGVLGRAHRRWRNVADHRSYWTAYDWSGQGEEWTASPEWKRALLDDVLLRWIPERVNVLEIGPGAGRWTKELLPRAERLTLVDVSERPLELCRQRFESDPRLAFVLSGGGDLPGIPDRSIDAVWSFDVLVHVAPCDQSDYLAEIARVLTPGGVAVLHHSDGRNRGRLPSRIGWRSPMSRGLFARLARDRGLQVEAQFDSWGPDGRFDLGDYGDAITVCRR